MKISVKHQILFTLICSCTLFSCEDFLEIEAPGNKMISEVVFENDETAESAMKGIYNQLFRSSFSNGGFDSVTILSGLSSDNLSPIRTTASPFMQFDQHDILPDNFRNLNLWSSAYNIIYLTNSLLEGIENSNNISGDLFQRLKGEASFIRAFSYFYLLNLYGDVPLILSTDYQENALISRASEEKIYAQVLTDLQTAEELLPETYSGNNRTQVTRYTAKAMLARIHLYLGNWSEAERLSSEVIAKTDTYEILDDLNNVFLANSKEAIWQISPEGGGTSLIHTNEGNLLIINPSNPLNAEIKLSESLITKLDSIDNRFLNWIGFDETTGYYFANKYKIRYSTALPITEFSMVLRLAEQYLIRAESRAMLGNVNQAIEDIDIIRERAGKDLLSENHSPLNKDQLLETILEERQQELFAEWGHRWLDLKRTQKAESIFLPHNHDWQNQNLFYPIPENELILNPNL